MIKLKKNKFYISIILISNCSYLYITTYTKLNNMGIYGKVGLARCIPRHYSLRAITEIFGRKDEMCSFSCLV